jgi:hypothetical protein
MPERPCKPKQCDRRCPTARIDGVQPADAGMKVKLVYWFMRKGMAKMTGRAPAAGRSGIEPIEIWAHQPKLLGGMASSSKP